MLPHLPEDIQSIPLGQHHIQNDQVVLVIEGSDQSDLAVRGDVNPIALGLKTAADKTGDLCFVFNHKDTHSSRLPQVHERRE